LKNTNKIRDEMTNASKTKTGNIFTVTRFNLRFPYFFYGLLSVDVAVLSGIVAVDEIAPAGPDLPVTGQTPEL
jgi:hypothetical protein